jgi:hypothetical protein
MRLSKTWLLLLVMFASCDTANNIDPVYRKNFVKYYGAAGAQSGVDLLVNKDGSMILLGNSVAPSGVYTGFVIKVNKFGNVIWQRQLGGPNETAVDVEVIDASSDRLELIAINNVGPEFNSNIRVLRFYEDNGASIDSVLVVPSEQLQPGMKRVAKSITPLNSQEGFIISGYADKNLAEETDPVDATMDQQDLLALKVDPSLDVITNVLQVGGERTGALIKAFEIERDGLPLAMFGYSDKPVEESFELNYTVYLPESGIVAAGSTAGSASLEEELSSVVKSDDGKFFLMAGTAKEPGAMGGDIYLVKYGDHFDLATLNKRITLNRSLVCVDADFSSGSDYLVVANEIGVDNHQNIVIVKVDHRGEKIWTSSFGTVAGDDTAAAIERLPDGRIAVVGTIELETNKKLALIVLNNRGGL